MTVWLVRENENLPGDDNNPRLQRMGLLAQEFEKLGCNVIWWQSTFNHLQKKFRFDSEKTIDWDNHLQIKLLHACSYSKNVSLRRIIHEKQTARTFFKRAKKIKKPDIIVAATPTIPYMHYAVRYARAHKIPIVVDVRDLQPDVYLDAFTGIKKALVSLFIGPVKRRFSKDLSNATALIGTTQPYLDWALNYAKREKKDSDAVFYVSYPDSGIITKLSDASRWKQYLEFDGLRCCFFGQFGNLVDFETMISAAEICKKEKLNVLFFLCGKGELLEHYQTIVKEKELGNVILPGWVNKTDIEDIGFLSDISLLAYKQSKNFEKQMTNKFSESLALGTAVLLQPQGIMKEVVSRNNCGMHYSNATELFECLKQLSFNSSLLKEMKANARILYENAFKAENVYKKYAEHVLKIAKEHRNEL